MDRSSSTRIIRSSDPPCSGTINDCRRVAEIETRAGGRKKLIELVSNPAAYGLYRPQDSLAAQSRAEAICLRAKSFFPKTMSVSN